jgi:hypothetical protein
VRIIAESYENGETVSAVARRHGLTPQQFVRLATACAADILPIAPVIQGTSQWC